MKSSTYFILVVDDFKLCPLSNSKECVFKLTKLLD